MMDEQQAASAGRPTPPDGDALTAATEAFRTLGLGRRVQILQLFVHTNDTLCGCEIADILSLEDYQVSRDLSALRKVGLVTSLERTGTWIHYELAPEPDAWRVALLELIGDLPLDPDTEGRLGMRLAFRERAGCVLGVGDPEVLAALAEVNETQQLPIRA